MCITRRRSPRSTRRRSPARHLHERRRRACSSDYTRVYTHVYTQVAFSAEYIRRHRPHVTFMSDDAALAHLGNACNQRLWAPKTGTAVPAYAKLDTAMADGDYHPCHATQFLASGIKAEPKVDGGILVASVSQAATSVDARFWNRMRKMDA
eukprot:7442902-Pyramimonas_sp.AAC.1